MKTINKAITEFKEMDELARLSSPVHALNPKVKLIAALAYIFTVASFNKYALGALIPMFFYPFILFMLSGCSIKQYFYKLRYVLPIVCAVGLFNPLLDRETAFTLGSVAVSRGVISMLTLMLKGVFCLAASYLLIATTPFDSICAALRAFRVPALPVTLMLLTYRYVTVMLEEVSLMTDAYMLRAPGQKGVQFSAWGSFLGQLLLRSADKASELYDSMRLRGFHGDFYYAAAPALCARDYLFLAAALALFALFRFTAITQILGAVLA